MKRALSEYIKDPIVSVIVENFSGTGSQQIRDRGGDRKARLDPVSRRT